MWDLWLTSSLSLSISLGFNLCSSSSLKNVCIIIAFLISKVFFIVSECFILLVI